MPEHSDPREKTTLRQLGLKLAGGHNDLDLSTLEKDHLCVDADDAILCYEKALLERSGYSVLTAASAPQALRLVTMCKCDAVVLDYEMPAVGGNEVVFEISLVRPEVIVILLSASEVPTQALALVDAFVPKLEASRQLLPTIAELCSRSQDARHNQQSVQHEDR